MFKKNGCIEPLALQVFSFKIDFLFSTGELYNLFMLSPNEYEFTKNDATLQRHFLVFSTG